MRMKSLFRRSIFFYPEERCELMKRRDVEPILKQIPKPPLLPIRLKWPVATFSAFGSDMRDSIDLWKNTIKCIAFNVIDLSWEYCVPSSF